MRKAACDQRRQILLGARKSNFSWRPRLVVIPSCYEDDRKTSLGFYIHHDSSLVVAKMALKQYREGAEYLKLLDLLSLETQYRYYSQGYLENVTVLCRIVDEVLLVRKQSIFIVKPQENKPFDICGFMICPHIGWLAGITANSTRRDIRYVEARGCELLYQKNIFLSREHLIRCQYCATEFQIEIESINEQKFAVILTKWHSFGGYALFQNRDWLNLGHNGNYLSWKRYRFRLGSIRAAFEGTMSVDCISLNA